jgi:hypothetical protein
MLAGKAHGHLTEGQVGGDFILGDSEVRLEGAARLNELRNRNTRDADERHCKLGGMTLLAPPELL